MSETRALIDALKPFAKELVLYGAALVDQLDGTIWGVTATLGDYRRALALVEVHEPGFTAEVRRQTEALDRGEAP